MAVRRVQVSQAILGADQGWTGPVAIDFDERGILGVHPLGAPPPGPRRLAMPALADAHNHGRPLSTTSFAASGKPLETWLIRLSVMPAVDPYGAAIAFFAHAALGGVASIMMHQTRPAGRTSLPDEAAEISRAANDVGIQAALAIGIRDRNPLVYGLTETATNGLPSAARQAIDELYRAPTIDPKAYVTVVEEVAEAAERPGFSIQFGPNGVHWCSDALLEAIAEASERTGRRVHMHLLETKYQRAWADQTLPLGIVSHLKDIGLLSPRLTLAHCVWARPDELALIAEAGATISVNSSSNLALKSGIAPVEAMVAKGVNVAIGLDNSAFDEDDDALRELRLFKQLHGGWGFDDVVTAQKALGFAASNGRRTLGLSGAGELKAGDPADILILDLDGLDRDAIMPVDPFELVFSRGRKEQIAELIVAGRTVVLNGCVPGIDLAAIEGALREEYRAGLGTRADYASVWSTIEPALTRFYRENLGCC